MARVSVITLFNVVTAGTGFTRGAASGVRGSLNSICDFKCKYCGGEVRVPSKQPELVVIGDDSLESVGKLCYSGDMISAGRGRGWGKICG